jgi:pimeloyl-ACP methyl ester carboxylesterase
MKQPLNNKDKQVILLIHGIRTHAWWMGTVKAMIEKTSGATVIPLKYDYFDFFRFWCPFVICRQGPINRLHKDLRNAIKQFGERPISAIAHSYGTYALARILLEHDDIKLKRIVLCGSIIPNSFPWARIANQITSDEMRNAVLNDCGTQDIWPVLAKSTTWGYGSSGTHGFGSVQVTDRIHAMPHSGYFHKDFVKKFWLPFIASGEIVPSAVERAGTGTSWWFSLVELPYKWLAAALVVFVIAAGSWTFVLPDAAKNWACNVVASGGVAACGNINAGNITITNKTGKPSQVPVPGTEVKGNVTAQDGVAAGGDIKAGDIKIESSQ